MGSACVNEREEGSNEGGRKGEKKEGNEERRNGAMETIIYNLEVFMGRGAWLEHANPFPRVLQMPCCLLEGGDPVT